MTSYRETEAEFPTLRDLSTFSADWYRELRRAHHEKYPESDVATRANLDMFVDMAEKREAAAGPALEAFECSRCSTGIAEAGVCVGGRYLCHACFDLGAEVIVPCDGQMDLFGASA